MMPKVGEKRVIDKFLVLPRCIEGEWRWLQRASYEEEYGPFPVKDVFEGHDVEVLGWSMTRWVEKPLKKGDPVVYFEYLVGGAWREADGTYLGKSEANPAFHHINGASGKNVRCRTSSEFWKA